MRRPASARPTRPNPPRSDLRSSIPVFAVVDVDKIPARCFGEPLCVATARRRCEKAYGALCETLARNGQVGITTVELDGAPCVAALLPIGGVLAVSPLRREYTEALACELRTRRAERRSQRYAPRPAEGRAAA